MSLLYDRVSQQVVAVADICIIYARPSRAVVRALYEILSPRYSVWWDEQIHSGDYRTEIENQLKQAKCVIPVWCRASRDSQNVVDEADYARAHGVPLLPVRIDQTSAPLGFGGLQTVELIGWNGDPMTPSIEELLSNIQHTIVVRPTVLRVGDKKLDLPVFFRSVSSHETAIQPIAAIQALKLVRCDAVLVSAYDIVHEERQSEIISDLTSLQHAGAVVLLDSGNYEASRKQDESWVSERLHQALAIAPHDMAFCFDDLTPPSDVEGVCRRIFDSVERDAEQTKKPILPIVHAPRQPSGEIACSLIPETIRQVCKELRPITVAIPERELGHGILARAAMVHSIRRALNTLGFYQPLHLLGTGNPLTIAILSAVGADSFDGLEWCRTAANSETGALYHFQQYDFFAWQSEEYGSPLVKDAVTSEKIEYSGKVIFHNLEFFSTWMADLLENLRGGKIERLLTEKVPGGGNAMKLLGKAVPEVFG